MIPSLIHQLVNHPKIHQADLSSVVHMNSGAAYLPPELAAKMASLGPKNLLFTEGTRLTIRCAIALVIETLLGYGMSEGVRRFPSHLPPPDVYVCV